MAAVQRSPQTSPATTPSGSVASPFQVTTTTSASSPFSHQHYFAGAAGPSTPAANAVFSGTQSPFFAQFPVASASSSSSAPAQQHPHSAALATQSPAPPRQQQQQQAKDAQPPASPRQSAPPPPQRQPSMNRPPSSAEHHHLAPIPRTQSPALMTPPTPSTTTTAAPTTSANVEHQARAASLPNNPSSGSGRGAGAAGFPSLRLPNFAGASTSSASVPIPGAAAAAASSSSSSLGSPFFRGAPTSAGTTAPATTTTTPLARFKALSPAEALAHLRERGPSRAVLTLDVRPHREHDAARVAHSVSAPLPSTLLRRATVGLDMVAGHVADESHRQRLLNWQHDAQVIIAIDNDSVALSEGCALAGLLAKFDRAGFKGQLAFVRGGFRALVQESKGRPHGDDAGGLLEFGPSNRQQPPASSSSSTASGSMSSSLTSSSSLGLQQAADSDSLSSASSSTAPTSAHSAPKPRQQQHQGFGFGCLSGRDLPIEAFQNSSTSCFAYEARNGNSSSAAGAAPDQHRSASPAIPGSLSLEQRPSSSGSIRRRSSAGAANRAKLRRDLAASMSLPPPQPQFPASSSSSQDAAMEMSPTRSSSSGVEAGDERDDSEDDALALPHVGRTSSSSGSGLGSGSGSERAACNPFFDNIRQNTEALSLSTALANLSPVDLPTLPESLLRVLPRSLARLVRATPRARAERLAREFYEIEAAERDRLTGVLNWHAHYQGNDKACATAEGAQKCAMFERFAISAGVELGNLNRFKNIFPYEHSRVHLEAHANPTDYINASHISFNALPKRFIASQGPLENTFADFWQMCLQEHVGVIVMLTNLFEGGREKCGRYWTKQFAGPFEIKVESEDDTAAADEEAGGFFGPCSLPTDSPLQRQRRSNNTVRRTIYVKRRDEPSAPPHKIRHLQYTAWPDFDVPADPSEVLTLVREVDKANRDFANETGRSDPPPILTHCSAGVGRTGVFIMASAMLESLTQRLREEPRHEDMELDGPPASGAMTPATALERTLSLASPHEREQPESEHTTPRAEHAPPIKRDDAIFGAVNEMREQRMSMIANYRQYVSVHETVLQGAIDEWTQHRHP